MSAILVYSEAPQTALGLLTKGRELAAELGKSLVVALLGEGAADQAQMCFAHGASKAYVASDAALEVFQGATYAAALEQIVTQAEADVILVGSTRRGRELAPRLAQKLAVGCATDVTGLAVVDGRLVTERRALGGNTIAAETVASDRHVVAVMPKLYEATAGDGAGGEIVAVSLTLEPPKTRLVERKPKEAGGVDVEGAEVLICIGRGLSAEGDLALIQGLADKLGGVIGCTRPISHENHWLPEDQMVGLSGKAASPRLYIGVGLSGQIQHTVGIMGAKVIVAVNSDKNAPIFKMVDYGVVGDLYDVVPKLVERLG